jgi:hypothetical protein
MPSEFKVNKHVKNEIHLNSCFQYFNRIFLSQATRFQGYVVSFIPIRYGKEYWSFFKGKMDQIISSIISLEYILKFIHSEKATNFCEISTVDLSYVVMVKSTVEISQNFVAYSEYKNFNIPAPVWNDLRHMHFQIGLTQAIALPYLRIA